jgi:sialidase-1
MNNLKAVITFTLVLFVLSNSNAQNSMLPSTDEVKESKWKGFERLDFKISDKNAYIIFPEKAQSGNPWIWRARFPGWHTDADSILVSEGFHLVHINTANQFGSPKAVKAWDDMYAHVTNKYNLNEKVALMGVSRGGLFVYNWAKSNPEKVSCIYGEAPVCDFKSWPMGKNGKRSDGDWNRLKEEYGFKTDEEAIAYLDNPIDNLEPLAKAKIPIMHMVGLEDKVVPVNENTLVLVNRYISLGGMATAVPCTEGEQKLEGHHFDIETPRYVADFIKYHSLQNLPLEASVYHEMAGGLQNSSIQFERNKTGRVAFLGGSITYNGGWRDSLMVYFQNRFPDTKFDFIAAGISSMGTTPSAFRLERDVLSKGQIDLLFVEAAVNDDTNGRTDKEQLRAMEGIVRHLRKFNPAIDIVMMHFVDPGKMEDYRKGIEPAVITNHNKVASHYKVPTINLAKEVTERIAHGEFTWKDDFINLHPSPFGQGVYANSMIQLLDNAYGGYIDVDDKITSQMMPEKLDPNCYDNGSLIDNSTIKLSKGWTLDASWNPNDGTGSRANYINVPMLISEKPGSTISINVKGNVVGIAVAAGKDAGMIEYRIDKGAWKKQDLFTKWSKSLHLPWYYTLATGLSAEEHKLEIRVSGERNEQSAGNACRIRYVYVSGE